VAVELALADSLTGVAWSKGPDDSGDVWEEVLFVSGVCVSCVRSREVWSGGFKEVAILML
jgi:hypothetical protein